MTDSDPPVVLIVEDEPAVAESYRIWLSDRYEVRVAETGEQALKRLADTDVVLLDRMMPGMSGDEVLNAIRDHDTECRVAMVTAINPELDVIELGFDAYVTKPPGRDELRSTVERLLKRAQLDESLQRYFSLAARRAALESAYPAERLSESDEYRALLERIDQCRDALDESTADLSSDSNFVGAVREVQDRFEDTSDERDRED